ncbi:MAG: response regulator [Deltaproteobacteria bacterium]|nr:response regulator [Deltaproteobacteria bacterium]
MGPEINDRARLAFYEKARPHIDLLAVGIDAMPEARETLMRAVRTLCDMASDVVLEDVLEVLAELELELDSAHPDRATMRELVGRLSALAGEAAKIVAAADVGNGRRDEALVHHGVARAVDAPESVNDELWACFVDEAEERLARLEKLAEAFSADVAPVVEVTCELLAVRDGAQLAGHRLIADLAGLMKDAVVMAPAVKNDDLKRMLKRVVDGMRAVCSGAAGDSARDAELRAGLEGAFDEVSSFVSRLSRQAAEQSDTPAPETGAAQTGIHEANRPVAREAAPIAAQLSAISEDEALIAELRAVFLEESREQIAALNDLLLALERAPSADAVQRIFRITHTLKGSAGTVGMGDAAKLAHGLEETFARVRKGEERVEGLSFDDLFARADALARAIGLPEMRRTVREAVASSSEPELALIDVARDADETGETEDRSVRVAIERLDALGNAAAELTIGQTRFDELVGTLRDATRSLSQQRAALRAALMEIERDGSTRRLATLEYDISDTLNGFERLHRGLVAEARVQRRTLDFLQDHVMRTRWVSLRGTFRRLQRPTRDLAHELGKLVRLDLVGEDTEIDRALAEAIIDPLIQLARNAVAHGIEYPADRRRRSKSEEGVVMVSARHQGGTVTIEVADDGSGLDPERIRRAAIERGLIDSEIATAISDEKIIEAVFMPGFTTRTTADLVSGHGVGLDVVAAGVARMGGTVQISSRPGVGSRFIIKLPLTLAVLQTLNFRVGRQTFALSLASVDGTVRLLDRHFETAGNVEGARVRGDWMPVVRLRRLWGLRDDSRAPYVAIVVDIVQRRYALIVDELIGRGEVIVKSLGAFLAPFRLYLGSAIVGRGGIRPILDPSAVWDLAAQPAEHSTRPTEGVESRGVVLVVDDSLIIRKVVAQLLEQNGYRVILATDGREGWSLLKTHHVDLIISDLEMPRMHGLEFLEKLKDSPVHAATPVLILSSRATRGNRARVLELGATDFLPKPVNERTVLESVKSALRATH